MTWYFFNERIWETISLVAIAVFLTVHAVHYFAEKKHTLFKILTTLLVLGIAMAIYIKTQHFIPGYKAEGIIDIILAVVIALITFDFIVLFARACGLVVSSNLERKLFWVIGGIYLAVGVLLLIVGTEPQFIRLDAVVDVLLQPFWVLILIRFLFFRRLKPAA